MPFKWWFRVDLGCFGDVLQEMGCCLCYLKVRLTFNRVLAKVRKPE